MKARTIFEQTGWKRPFPETLCQDFDVARRVTEYDYRLTDPDFQSYCQGRDVLFKAGDGPRFEFTADLKATREQFFEHYELRHAKDSRTGARRRYTDEQMEVQWQIMLAAKGFFQDCWEQYQAKRKAESPAPSQTAPEIEPREAREQLDLSINDMAALCGVHRQTWVKWERGERAPDKAAIQLMKMLLWLNDRGMLEEWRTRLTLPLSFCEKVIHYRA